MLVLSLLLTVAPAWTVKTANTLGDACTKRADARACTKLLALANSACDAEVADACFRRAGLLLHTKLPGITRDEAAGNVALDKACALGQQTACMLVASNRMLATKFDEAAQVLERSCGAGYAPACRMVGGAHRMTKGGALADDSAGLSRQCEQEPRLTADACFELGRRRRASGDVAGAVAALERACHHWSTDACHSLFEWYVTEDAGVPTDAWKAKAWLDEGERRSRAIWIQDAGL